jgi:hypothetical protein
VVLLFVDIDHIRECLSAETFLLQMPDTTMTTTTTTSTNVDAECTFLLQIPDTTMTTTTTTSTNVDDECIEDSDKEDKKKDNKKEENKKKAEEEKKKADKRKEANKKKAAEDKKAADERKEANRKKAEEEKKKADERKEANKKKASEDKLQMSDTTITTTTSTNVNDECIEDSEKFSEVTVVHTDTNYHPDGLIQGRYDRYMSNFFFDNYIQKSKERRKQSTPIAKELQGMDCYVLYNYMKVYGEYPKDWFPWRPLQPGATLLSQTSVGDVWERDDGVELFVPYTETLDSAQRLEFLNNYLEAFAGRC